MRDTSAFGRINDLEQQLAAAQARIAELIAVLENVYCDPKMVLSEDTHHHVKQIVEGRTSTVLDDLKARYEARIAELRDALGVLAQCAIDAIETDHDINEIIKRFNTSINGALKETDNLSALEEAKRQARREALIEAADYVFDLDVDTSLFAIQTQLRRMAGEVK